MGHNVVSTWHDRDEHALNEAIRNGEYGGVAYGIAQRAIRELVAADTLVVFSEYATSAHPGGGHNVELGFALAAPMRIICIGPRQTIFHFADAVEKHDDWQTALRTIEAAPIA